MYAISHLASCSLLWFGSLRVGDGNGKTGSGNMTYGFKAKMKV